MRWPRALLRAEAFDVVHVNGSADHRLCMLAAAGLAENVTEGGNGWIVPVSAPPRVAETLADILAERIYDEAGQPRSLTRGTSWCCTG